MKGYNEYLTDLYDEYNHHKKSYFVAKNNGHWYITRYHEYWVEYYQEQIQKTISILKRFEK